MSHAPQCACNPTAQKLSELLGSRQVAQRLLQGLCFHANAETALAFPLGGHLHCWHRSNYESDCWSLQHQGGGAERAVSHGIPELRTLAGRTVSFT